MPAPLIAAAKKPTPAADEKPKVLYRATAGKVTISTHVVADELPRFLANYSAVLRASTPALRKTKKADKKRAAAAAAAGGAGAAAGRKA